MRSLAGLLLTVVAGCGSGPAAPDVTSHAMQIESVDVLVAESSPPQVSARVRGIIPDGCSRAGVVALSRAGNAITLSVFVDRENAGQPCIQIIEVYDRVHRLPGDFPPGHYTLTVNGVIRAFVI